MATQATIPVFKGKTKLGLKYKDQTRYPKVVTAGYEKEFVNDYKKQTKLMVKDLARKSIKLQKENEN